MIAMNNIIIKELLFKIEAKKEELALLENEFISKVASNKIIEDMDDGGEEDDIECFYDEENDTVTFYNSYIEYVTDITYKRVDIPLIKNKRI